MPGATNCYEDYLLSLCKEVVSRCNKIILQDTNIVREAECYQHQQHKNVCNDHNMLSQGWGTLPNKGK